MLFSNIWWKVSYTLTLSVCLFSVKYGSNGPICTCFEQTFTTWYPRATSVRIRRNPFGHWERQPARVWRERNNVLQRLATFSFRYIEVRSQSVLVVVELANAGYLMCSSTHSLVHYNDSLLKICQAGLRRLLLGLFLLQWLGRGRIANQTSTGLQKVRQLFCKSLFLNVECFFCLICLLAPTNLQQSDEGCYYDPAQVHAYMYMCLRTIDIGANCMCSMWNCLAGSGSGLSEKTAFVIRACQNTTFGLFYPGR